jgi:hypothetical protein
MIILRQKEYATGAERAMIAMNKGKNISPKPISERAALISQDKRDRAIRKINQSLGPGSIQGRGGSVMGHFRGKSARMRVKMGYNSPEAVEALRKRKISAVLSDSKMSPEGIAAEMTRKKDGHKIKEAVSKVGTATKGTLRNIYENTGKLPGKAAKVVVSNPDVALVSGASSAAGFALPPALNAAYQANPVARPSMIYVGARDAIGVSNIPVKVKARDAAGKIIRDQAGKKVTKKVPLSKVTGHWGRKAQRWIDKGIGDKSIKGILTKVRDSHRASHPYENRVPV